jgi:eukaryotic-like serine/threonine-protein kinase
MLKHCAQNSDQIDLKISQPYDSDPREFAVIGPTVGQYRILQKLGAGGMGLVYEAEDTQLGRRVALKFLPDELCRDPDTLRRFEQEARAASALNHPNICTIYHIGQYDGRPFIAMELLQGRTLKERIDAGRISGEELITWALELAEALDAAHSAGIIHRDLKPANVFISSRNTAKLLDFGLAKQKNTSRVSSDAPTISFTTPGSAVGTLGYMSPEQARGEELDARTDLFALGAVIYEMATGRPAFPGSVSAVIFDGILNRTPQPPTQINPALPTEVDAIVDKALEKQREYRYQSAKEIRTDLSRLRRRLSSNALHARPGKSAHYQHLWLWAVAPLLLLILMITVYFRVAARPNRAIRQQVLTANARESALETAAISPDGKYLAFSDSQGINIKLIDRDDIQVLPNTKALIVADWFPDGTKILAFRPGKDNTSFELWSVPLVAGVRRKLADHISAIARVSPDGRLIMFAANGFPAHEVWVMGPEGEEPRRVMNTSDSGGVLDVIWAPSSSRFAYLHRTSVEGHVEFSLKTSDLQGNVSDAVFSAPELNGGGNTGLWWLRDGRILFVQYESAGASLWGMKVDPTTGRSLAKAAQIIDKDGTVIDSVSGTADGKRIVFIRTTGSHPIYVAELASDRGALERIRRLNSDNWDNFPSSWTRDGSAIFFSSIRRGKAQVFKQRLTQSIPERLVSGRDDYGGAVESFDGLWLLFSARSEKEKGLRLMRMPISGGTHDVVLTSDSTFAGYQCASRANRCLLAEITEKGGIAEQVYSSFDPVRGRGAILMKVDSATGSHYDFSVSPDGQRVAFVSSSDKIAILDLERRSKTELALPSHSSAKEVSWSVDQKSLFISAVLENEPTPSILRVDFAGHITHLFHDPNGWAAAATPSPDGHFLAFTNTVQERNAVMLEDF